MILGMVISLQNKLKNLNQKGLSLLEALISTAIVGIGFVAIFQMVNFSINSINTSGERTKANYLTSIDKNPWHINSTWGREVIPPSNIKDIYSALKQENPKSIR